MRSGPMADPNPLLTPRSWQIEATVRAAKLSGTPEGELALVEAKRYGLMADELDRLRDAAHGVPGTEYGVRAEPHGPGKQSGCLQAHPTNNNGVRGAYKDVTGESNG